MNAILCSQSTVMKILHALTHLAVMNVSVTSDSVEMGQIAQVNSLHTKLYFLKNIVIVLDIDECSNDTLNNCDINASCMDIEGSYLCMCDIGYTGNGSFCDGKSKSCHLNSS